MKVRKKFLILFVVGIIFFPSVVPEFIVHASEQSVYQLIGGYDDASTLGDGVFAKKGGLFSNVKSTDEYYYIDDNGNEKCLTESIKKNNIDAFYKTTTGVNCLLNGVVTVGKNGKITFMDSDGNLWGEAKFENVSYVNDNMFLGTMSGDDWKLYRKDGTLIESFEKQVVQNKIDDESSVAQTAIQNNKDLDVEETYEISIITDEQGNKYEKIISNNAFSDYTYIHERLLVLMEDVNGYQLNLYEKTGNKILEIKDVSDAYYVSEYSDYFAVPNYDKKQISVYDYNGNRIFVLNNMYMLDVEALQKWGYAVACGYDEKGSYTEYLVDIKGNVIASANQINGFDNKHALLEDENSVRLINMSNQEELSVTMLLEEMKRQDYETFTSEVYYCNEHVLVATAQNVVGEEWCSDLDTKLFDINGKEKFSKEGYYFSGDADNDMSEEYIILSKNSFTFNTEKALLNYKGDVISTGFSTMFLWDDSYFGSAKGAVAIVGKNDWDGYGILYDNDIVVRSNDSSVTFKYVNGHCIISTSKGKQIVDEYGKTVVSAGKYSDFMLNFTEPFIIGLNELTSDIIDFNGQVINKNSVYKNVSHTSKFSDFETKYESISGARRNPMTSTRLLVADNSSTGKVDVVTVVNKLPAVQNLKAVSAGANKVNLSWSVVEGAEGYLVYAQKNGKYGYVGMTTKGTTYTDTKALDTAYNFYWVFPYYKLEGGKMIVGGTPQYKYAKGITPAVTNLKASSITNGVKLTWNKSIDAEGYLIYGIVNGGTYGYVGMTTKGTTYIDKTASKTQYNFYWVFPYHKNTNGKLVVGGTAHYTYGRAK